MLIKWVQGSVRLRAIACSVSGFLVSNPNSNVLFPQDAAEKRTVIMNRKAMRKLQLLDHNVGDTAVVREPASTRKPTAAREPAVAFT